MPSTSRVSLHPDRFSFAFSTSGEEALFGALFPFHAVPFVTLEKSFPTAPCSDGSPSSYPCLQPNPPGSAVGLWVTAQGGGAQSGRGCLSVS